MITHSLDLRNKQLVICVSADMTSTTVEQQQQMLSDIISKSSVWGEPWDKLVLDLRATQMLDSLGLNMLVGLVKRVKDRDATIVTHLKNRIVYQTLLATRMDKQMDIKLEEK